MDKNKTESSSTKPSQRQKKRRKIIPNWARIKYTSRNKGFQRALEFHRLKGEVLVRLLTMQILKTSLNRFLSPNDNNDDNHSEASHNDEWAEWDDQIS